MRDFDFRDQLSTMAKERLAPSEIGEMGRLAAEYGAIPFTSGEPSAEIYPVDELREAFCRVIEDTELLAYYKYDFGLIELREWIVERMRKDSMIPDWVRAENILLTNGAGEAIDHVAQALIDPGSLVLVEAPTFTDALLTFRKQGAQCVSVPSDDDGIVPGALEEILKKRRVRLLYTIPNYQNPSGRTSPPGRREAILKLAEKYGIPILEDDPYHYLGYDGEPPSTYIKLAGGGQRVFHSNSFSKLVAPGIRVGWLVVPDAVIPQLTALRVCAGLSRPAFVHKGLYNYLGSISFEERVAALRNVYRERRDAMTLAVEKDLKPLGVRTNYPRGGFFLWGEKKGIGDITDFTRFAVEKKKIAIVPGTAFFPQDEEEMGREAFRVSFAKVGPKDAAEGVARLAEAFSEYSRAWKKL